MYTFSHYVIPSSSPLPAFSQLCELSAQKMFSTSMWAKDLERNTA